MIDVGLLVSMVAAVGVPMLVQRWWPLRTVDGVSVLDLVVVPAVVGLVVGRLVAVALDAPGSLTRIGDLMIIRSGVEFWPGAAVAAALIGVDARRQGVPVVGRLADLAPLGLVGYATYEAGCIVRDGCFGPASPVGLRPPGAVTTMVPIGLGVAAAVGVVAVFVHRISVGTVEAPQPVPDSGAWLRLVSAVAGLAAVRSTASIWLPHVGEGLTRPHVTSIGVALVTVPAAVGLALRMARSDRSHVHSGQGSDPP